MTETRGVAISETFQRLEFCRKRVPSSGSFSKNSSRVWNFCTAVLLGAVCAASTGHAQEYAQSGANRDDGAPLDVADPIRASNGAFYWDKPLFNLGGPMNFSFGISYRSDPPGGFEPVPGDFPHTANANYAHNAWRRDPAPFGLYSYNFHTGATLADFRLLDQSTVSFAPDEEAGPGHWQMNIAPFWQDNGISRFYELSSSDEWFFLNDSQAGLIYLFERMGATNETSSIRLREVHGRVPDMRLTYTYATTNDTNPSVISDGHGRSLSFQYNAERTLLTHVTDQAGRSWHFDYAPASWTNTQLVLRNLTGPDGETTTFHYQYLPKQNFWHPENPLLLTRAVEPRGYSLFSNTYAMIAMEVPEGLFTARQYPRVTTQYDALGNLTTLTYTNNPQSNYVVRLNYPDGTTEEYVHFSSHSLPKSLTDQQDNTIHFEKNANEQLTAVTDRLGDTTHMAYNMDNRAIETVTNPAGESAAFYYATQWQTFTNPYAPSVTYTFSYSVLTNIVYSDGSREYIEYDARGLETSRTDRAGAVWTATYDARGRLLAMRNPMGGETLHTWHDNGLPATETASDGLSETYHYDAHMRLAAVTNAAGFSRHYEYDNHDRLVRHVDEIGRVRTYEYDAQGNLTRSVAPGGITNSIQYDPMNRRTNQVNAAGLVSRFAYDSMGRLISVTGPDGLTATMQYDPRGGVTNTAFGGRTVAQDVNAEGQPTARTAPGIEAMQIETDAMGRVIATENGLANRWTFVRDAAGRMVAEIDPTGLVVSNIYNEIGLPVTRIIPGRGASHTAYNALGLPTEVTDFMSNTWRHAYSPFGLLLAVTNPLNQATFYEYDTQRRLVRETLPTGGALEFGYDAASQLIRFTDAAGRAWTNVYNDAGQLVRQSNPAGFTQHFSYWADGRLMAAWDDETAPTTNNYDAAGRVIGLTKADGATTTYAWDEATGLLAAETDARGFQRQLEYNAAGQLIRSRGPEGTNTHHYDAIGRLVALSNQYGGIQHQLDPLGRATNTIRSDGYYEQRTYDQAGRMVYNRTGTQEAEYFYDGENNLVRFRTGMGRETRYYRDALGQATSVVHAAGQTEFFEYDAAGRVTKHTDALGRARQWVHDPSGKLLSVLEHDGGSTTNIYDVAGHLVRLADLGGNQWHLHRSPGGRLVALEDPLDQRTDYTYDLRGRLASIANADGTIEHRTYDPSGYVTNRAFSGSQDITPASISFTRDPNGEVGATDHLVLHRETGGAITSSVHHGVAFGAVREGVDRRLARATYRDNAWHVDYTYSPERTRLEAVEDSLTGTRLLFGYDADDRLVSIQRTNTSQSASGAQTTYTLDPLNRITGLAQGDFIDLAYGRDAAGQVTQLVARLPLSPTSTAFTARSETFPVDAASQINAPGFVYDAQGRLISKPAQHGNTNFVWDAAGRLIQVGQTEFQYNGLGQCIARVQAGATNRYFFNNAISSAALVAEQRASDGTFIRYYVWSPNGHLLYMIDAAQDNAVYHYHFDATGNTLALSDAGGHVAAAYAMDPDGQLLGQTGEIVQPFLFNGQQGARREGNHDLYHMQVRWYDARTRRFLSREPLWPTLTDPVQINPYQYAANNPVFFTDPSGLSYGLPTLMQMQNPNQIAASTPHQNWWSPGSFRDDKKFHHAPYWAWNAYGHHRDMHRDDANSHNRSLWFREQMQQDAQAAGAAGVEFLALLDQIRAADERLMLAGTALHFLDNHGTGEQYINADHSRFSYWVDRLIQGKAVADAYDKFKWDRFNKWGKDMSVFVMSELREHAGDPARFFSGWTEMGRMEAAYSYWRKLRAEAQAEIERLREPLEHARLQMQRGRAPARTPMPFMAHMFTEQPRRAFVKLITEMVEFVGRNPDALDEPDLESILFHLGRSLGDYVDPYRMTEQEKLESIAQGRNLLSGLASSGADTVDWALNFIDKNPAHADSALDAKGVATH